MKGEGEYVCVWRGGSWEEEEGERERRGGERVSEGRRSVRGEMRGKERGQGVSDGSGRGRGWGGREVGQTGSGARVGEERRGGGWEGENGRG